MLSLDQRMRSYASKGDDSNDGNPTSPTFFNFDAYGFNGANFLRPPVWTGAGNAADGLLGCQAPAADGLDETFTIYPESAQNTSYFPQHQAQPLSAVKPPKVALPVPTEIHLQILEHLVDVSEARSCSFCHMFELSTLSKVSRLYHSLLEPYIYRTVHLDFTSSLDFGQSLIHKADTREICDEHRSLASKHQQLDSRLPQLIRTLESRPDLAAEVRTIILPPGGTQTFLTCTQEKTLLPALIKLCPNIEEVKGVDSLLARQFFSGEHFCFDGENPQQHGLFAKTLVETKTIRKWSWVGGNAGGRDIPSRLFDNHPQMATTGFIGSHRNWSNLRELEIRDVWNLDADMMRKLMGLLPKLQSVALVGIRKKRTGRADVPTIMATLEALPATVRHIELGATNDESFLLTVGEWIRVRHTIKEFSMLESMRFTNCSITAANVRGFFRAISLSVSPRCQISRR